MAARDFGYTIGEMGQLKQISFGEDAEIDDEVDEDENLGVTSFDELPEGTCILVIVV